MLVDTVQLLSYNSGKRSRRRRRRGDEVREERREKVIESEQEVFPLSFSFSCQLQSYPLCAWSQSYL